MNAQSASKPGVFVAPAMRDLSVLAAQLVDWLGRRMPGARNIRVDNLDYPRGAGQSHETILFDAAWDEGGAARSRGMVVRIKPTSFTVFLDDMFVEQYQLMRAMHDSGKVRVAEVLWFEEDPTLLGAPDPGGTPAVHDLEVFGPVATLVPYRDRPHALDLVRRGQGSLVVSLFGSDSAALASSAIELADSHGRVHVVSPDVAAIHTGHGNVMPQSLHGGPGRAGGGEELGGLRALGFYHRRAALQASAAVLQSLA